MFIGLITVAGVVDANAPDREQQQQQPQQTDASGRLGIIQLKVVVSFFFSLFFLSRFLARTKPHKSHKGPHKNHKMKMKMKRISKKQRELMNRAGRVGVDKEGGGIMLIKRMENKKNKNKFKVFLRCRCSN